MPVAASTLCLLMLSLDRYATVKNPRFGQLRQRRNVPIFLAIAAWASAFLVCMPVFFAFEADSVYERPSAVSSLLKSKKNPSTKGKLINHVLNSTNLTHKVICRANYGSKEMHTVFAILYATIVFILPAMGIMLNHIGVRQKLCALSLTARAAHGELPLPMPILRRPTHMIIVTGMANNRLNGVDSSNEENNRISQMPRTPR